MKTTVIYHSADFDGLFCREIARKFLPDAELIGWDFADAPIPVPDGQIYVMDLPLDAPFGGKRGEFNMGIIIAQQENRLVWIDHHKTAIDSHAPETHGYRIDGVAACRLAWFYFTALERYKAQTTTADFTWFQGHYPWATKQDFVDRKVEEPLPVRLAGEYDIWDKRDPRARLFQSGLRSEPLEALWGKMLDDNWEVVEKLLSQAPFVDHAKTLEYEETIRIQGFTMQWEGYCWLVCNNAKTNVRSQLFEKGLRPEHEGMLGFGWVKNQWVVSLYNDTGKDFSPIAKKYGGGGHPGACGFQCKTLPFEL